MSSRLYNKHTQKNRSNIKLWGKTPQHFFKHLQEYYDTNTNNNKLKKIKPYNELIKDFIKIDENNNKELEKKEYIDFAKKIFTTNPNRESFIAILNFAAGDKKIKIINIYEWLIINYFFEINNHNEFTKTRLLNTTNQENYKKFVQSVMNNKAFTKYIDTKHKEELKNELQQPSSSQTPAPSPVQNQPPLQRLKLPPTQRQQQQPLLTARTTTKIHSRIQKKIELVQKFNKNLNKFNEKYEGIKELIIKEWGGYGNAKSIIINDNADIINRKFKEIINNSNNCNQNIIEQQNIENLNSNDDFDESIQMFILLCYYINEINCILTEFDNELQENKYTSNVRFSKNKESIKYLQKILKEIIKQKNNNSDSEFTIDNEKMDKVCENIKKILEKIFEIFIGIRNDLNITLIEEIIGDIGTRSVEFASKNITSNSLKESFVKIIPLRNNTINISRALEKLNALKPVSRTPRDNQKKLDHLNQSNITNLIEFYKNRDKINTRSHTSTLGKNKQDILRSIRNYFITHYKDIDTMPIYEYLDAKKIYTQ